MVSKASSRWKATRRVFASVDGSGIGYSRIQRRCYRGVPEMTKGVINALVANDFLLQEVQYRTSRTNSQQYEISRNCTLTEKAYKAVDNDFNAPD